MLFGKFIDETCDRIKKDKKNPDDRELAARKINKAYKEILNNSSIKWPYLIRTGEIRTVANYTTGTVSITNGSRTVTGAGTVWTSAMEGRYFQPQGSKNWYRIRRVENATSLILYSAIKEDSASSQTHIIWKRFYYFPSEVRKVLEFGSWIQNGIIEEKSLYALRDQNKDISLTGEPEEFSMFGADPFESSYSEGTVSVTEDNNLLTGSGTSWLDNVEEGDRVEIGTDIYRVKRVESDTRIRLLNSANSTASGASYTIHKENNLGFQLWFNPNDVYILPYTYLKRVYDMVNEEYDRPEVPEEFDAAILDLAEADRLADMDDSKWINKQALATARISDLRRMLVSTPRKRQFKPYIENNRGSYL